MAAEWKEIPFSEAVLLNPTTPLKTGSVYPFVDMQAIAPGERGVRCSEHRAFTGGGSRFQNQDTLMARITPCLENGKIARFLAPNGEPIGHGSTEFIVVRGRLGVTDNDYAYYLTTSPEVRNFAISQMTGSSGRQRVPTDSLSNIDVLLPPLAEQKTIAGILSVLDDKIELNQLMNDTLEALIRSLFKSRFVDAIAIKLPKGWRVGKLRDCCERVENGGTPKRDEPSYWTPATIPWLTSGEVRQAIVTKTENFISEQGLENSSAKLWPTATTVVALYGATAGQVCFLGDTMCSNQACCGLIPKMDLRYYVYLHASSSVAALEQQTRGSAQQNLSQQIVADFPTTIPDDDALDEFNEAVHPLFVRWIANLFESRTLAELRDALLPKLLSGELRIPSSKL